LAGSHGASIKVVAEALAPQASVAEVDKVRPSFLLGQRAEARAGERVGIFAAKMVVLLLIGPLMIYHPIPAASVARAREPGCVKTRVDDTIAQ
jgi:hypothetical protein